MRGNSFTKILYDNGTIILCMSFSRFVKFYVNINEKNKGIYLDDNDNAYNRLEYIFFCEWILQRLNLEGYFPLWTFGWKRRLKETLKVKFTSKNKMNDWS